MRKLSNLSDRYAVELVEAIHHVSSSVFHKKTNYVVSVTNSESLREEKPTVVV